MTPQPPDTTPEARAFTTDIVAVFLLVLAGVIHLYRIEVFLDIGLYDESNYLAQGLAFPGVIPDASLAPLYSLWYWTLSFIKDDPVQLYFLNYRAMTIVPVLMLFILLRGFRISRLIAFVLALGFLLSQANFPTWPKVSHFTLIVILGGVIIANLGRTRLFRATVFTLTALLATFVRPEFLLSFLLMLAVWIIILLRQRDTFTLGQYLRAASVVFIPSIILIILFGLPGVGSSRSMEAFGQHFARNHVKWSGEHINPWTTWETIVEEEFGEVDSPFQALVRKPSAVARHVLYNARVFPGTLWTTFGAIYPHLHRVREGLWMGLLVLGLLLLYHVQSLKPSGWRERAARNIGEYRLQLLALVAFLVPPLLSCFMIAPRLHYMLMLGVLAGVMLLIASMGNVSLIPEKSEWIALTAASIVMLLFIRPISESIAGGNQPVLSTIWYLRALDIEKPVNLLEAEGGYDTYLGDNFTRVPEYAKRQSFNDFLKHESINMIIESGKLNMDIGFREDPEWLAFRNSPARQGFCSYVIPGTGGRRLLIQRDVDPMGGEGDERD